MVVEINGKRIPIQDFIEDIIDEYFEEDENLIMMLNIAIEDYARRHQS